MMTPFEEHLLSTLFPDILAWQSDSVASYVLHRHNDTPIFFRKLTDDVLEYGLAHGHDVKIYSVKTDGTVTDVTDGWLRVFEKHKTTKASIDTLLASWTSALPNDIATMELKVDGVTVGYYPKPTIETLRAVERVRDVTRLTILVIHTSGVVKDMTTQWHSYFTEYMKLRFKEM
jgi:hypothetical protein